MSRQLRRMVLILLVAIVAAVPVFAGSAVVGSVAGSLNASVGGQALLPQAVVFSGDTLQVKEGAAVVALENGSRMAFGRDTVAQVVKEGEAVKVALSQGNVSIYQADAKVPLAVEAGGTTITPGVGFKTLGEVAMVNGTLVVNAKQGSLKVVRQGKTVDVAQGKTLTVTPGTARAPQAGGAQKLGGSTALEAGALGAGVVAAILAGIGISRSNDAKDAANAANATAASAVSAANAADTDAKAATDAANAATVAATNAWATANQVGCALNIFANGEDQPSPYLPGGEPPNCTYVAPSQ